MGDILGSKVPGISTGTGISVSQDDVLTVPEKGQEGKSDGDSGWEEQDGFCHAPKSLVPEVTGNETASTTVSYQPLSVD